MSGHGSLARTAAAGGDSQEEEDPIIRKLKNTGCLELHYNILECMADHKDWRKCQKPVQDFRQCMQEYEKTKPKLE